MRRAYWQNRRNTITMIDNVGVLIAGAVGFVALLVG